MLMYRGVEEQRLEREPESEREAEPEGEHGQREGDGKEGRAGGSRAGEGKERLEIEQGLRGKERNRWRSLGRGGSCEDFIAWSNKSYLYYQEGPDRWWGGALGHSIRPP